MSSNDYHFITHWRVESTLEEVFRIISDAAGLSRWWPSVYLEVTDLNPEKEFANDKEIGLYTKGWLPYTLRWQFRVYDVRYPYGFSLEAWGDFTGRGIWTFEQDGPWVEITYDWKIRADKPLLRNFSFLMKPVFSANHRWAMAKGEESLRLELARCRACTAEEQAQVPPPPRPTTTSPVPLLLGMAGILGLAAALLFWITK